MFDVLEHVADAYGALCEAARVLRDDGRLLLTTPNTLGLGLYDSFADSTHVHHFTWRSVEELLTRAGLSRIFPITLHLHSFWPLNQLRVRALLHVQQSICIVASRG
jgi:SAM-dependent methyltransferase